MVNTIVDASPGKKQKGIPRDQEGRKAYYENLMTIYAAQNPVKFEAKKEELERKAKGFEYIAGKWVNVFDAANLKAEMKLTASQQEQAAEQEKIHEVENLKTRNAELEARLGALEAVKKDEVKPKGRPKKK